MSNTRIAESAEGLNSSLSQAAGDLWPKKVQSIAVVNFVQRKVLPEIPSCHKARSPVLYMQIFPFATIIV